MKKITKTLATIFTIALIVLAGSNVKVSAVEFKSATIPSMNNISQMETVNAVDSRKVVVESKKDPLVYYLKLTLKEDSWVRFSGSYSLNNHDGIGTDVAIYTNSSFTNKKGEYGWGYWRYNTQYINFLSKGTYYVSVSSTFENYQEPFKGNINITAVAIPISKIFNTKVTVASNKKNATVSFSNVLGEYTDYVEYQKGSVALSNVNKSSYWQWLVTSDFWSGNEKAIILKNSKEKYSFKVAANGNYTIMIQAGGARYSKVIKVSGIDKTKPTVKGVKNKKTYKKAVKIKFSDKGSGIKSAKLNGKKIKSGKKVSKAGKYKLVVTDKAGNKTTIKFTIKKKK